jgi:ribosomal protein S14
MPFYCKEAKATWQRNRYDLFRLRKKCVVCGKSSGMFAKCDKHLRLARAAMGRYRKRNNTSSH